MPFAQLGLETNDLVHSGFCADADRYAFRIDILISAKKLVQPLDSGSDKLLPSVYHTCTGDVVPDFLTIGQIFAICFSFRSGAKPVHLTIILDCTGAVFELYCDRTGSSMITEENIAKPLISNAARLSVTPIMDWTPIV